MAVPFLSDLITLASSSTLRFVVFELVILFVSALFIWTGAKVAQIKQSSIIKSFIAAIVLAVLVPLLLIPFSGHVLASLALGMVVTLAIIKIVFATGWRKSLVTWIFSIIAEFVAFFALTFLLVLLV